MLWLVCRGRCLSSTTAVSASPCQEVVPAALLSSSSPSSSASSRSSPSKSSSSSSSTFASPVQSAPVPVVRKDVRMQSNFSRELSHESLSKLTLALPHDVLWTNAYLWTKALTLGWLLCGCSDLCHSPPQRSAWFSFPLPPRLPPPLHRPKWSIGGGIHFMGRESNSARMLYHAITRESYSRCGRRRKERGITSFRSQRKEGMSAYLDGFREVVEEALLGLLVHYSAHLALVLATLALLLLLRLHHAQVHRWLPFDLWWDEVQCRYI